MSKEQNYSLRAFHRKNQLKRILRKREEDKWSMKQAKKELRKEMRKKKRQ